MPLVLIPGLFMPVPRCCGVMAASLSTIFAHPLHTKSVGPPLRPDRHHTSRLIQPMSPPDLHVTRPGPSSCTSYTESIQPLSCSQAYSPCTCIHTHIGSTLGVVIPVPRRPGATAASYPIFPPRVSTSSGWDHLRAPCTRNLSNRCHVPKHIPVLIHTLVPIVGWLSPY